LQLYTPLAKARLVAKLSMAGFPWKVLEDLGSFNERFEMGSKQNMNPSIAMSR